MVKTVWRKLWSKVGSGGDLTPATANTALASSITALSEKPARGGPSHSNAGQPPVRPHASVGGLLNKMLEQNEAPSMQGGERGEARPSKQSYDHLSDEDKVARLEAQRGFLK